MPTAEELESLSMADALSNERAMQKAGYKSAKHASSDVSDHQAVKEAHALGVDVARIHKDLRARHALDPAKLRDDLIKELATESQRIRALFVEATKRTAWVLLGNSQADRAEVFKGLRARGHREDAIYEALKAIDGVRAERNALSTDPRARQDQIEAKLRAVAGPAVRAVDPSRLPDRTYDKRQVDPLVIESAERAKKGGHTLGTNEYVERHLTPEVMAFLTDHAEMTIEVYEGKTSEALRHVASRGYTEIRPLSDNPMTDFRKFTARRPADGKASLVVVGAPGRAYQREIAAHFVYYNLTAGTRIDPGRIRHRVLTDPNPAVSEFAKTLKVQRLDPDIVLMGNVEEVKAKLGKEGIAPVRELLAPNLYGWVYDINGKSVLSLKVEPYLYADRAGAFVTALQERSAKRRTVVFTGTAGALDQTMEIGDLVAPAQFQRSDTMLDESVGGSAVRNLAVDTLSEMGALKGDAGIFSGPKVTHGAVESILFEDEEWFKARRGALSIVEQELAGVAAAVAASSGAQTDLYAFFRISDVLGKQDFTKNETHRPKARTKFEQGDVVLTVLSKALGEAPRPSAAQGKTQGAVLTRDPRTQDVTFEMPGLIFRITGHVDALTKIEPKLAAQLNTRLPQVIHEHRNDSPTDLARAVKKLYGQYGIKPEVTSAAPVVETLIKFAYAGAGPLHVRLTHGSARAVLDVDATAAAKVGIWEVKVATIPRGDPVHSVATSTDQVNWTMLPMKKPVEGGQPAFFTVT